MNKLLLGYAIYDKQVKSYGQPFFVNHEIHAKRNFIKLIQDKETLTGTFTEDFILFKTGTFNTETGQFDTEIELVMDGEKFKNKGE